MAQLGWLTNLQVPQRWFLHFYVAGTACNSAFLFAAWPQWASTGLSNDQVVSLLSLTLLEVHLVRRMLETACIMSYPVDAKMHLIAYAFGLSYYVVLPLSCLPAALLTEPKDFATRNYTADWKTVAFQPQHLLAMPYNSGHTGFWPVYGDVYQSPQALRKNFIKCLQFLRACRGAWSTGSAQNSINHANSWCSITKYIQHASSAGGPFYWVSCPHYLAEIIIYVGLATLARSELPLTVLILCWVVTNLLLAAQPTHLWYQQHFVDYPKNRKALVPYLY